jgi:hypothetical protein
VKSFSRGFYAEQITMSLFQFKRPVSRFPLKSKLNTVCEASHPQKMVRNWGYVSFLPTKIGIMDRLRQIVERGKFWVRVPVKLQKEWIKENQGLWLW